MLLLLLLAAGVHAQFHLEVGRPLVGLREICKDCYPQPVDMMPSEDYRRREWYEPEGSLEIVQRNNCEGIWTPWQLDKLNAIIQGLRVEIVERERQHSKKHRQAMSMHARTLNRQLCLFEEYLTEQAHQDLRDPQWLHTWVNQAEVK